MKSKLSHLTAESFRRITDVLADTFDFVSVAKLFVNVLAVVVELFSCPLELMIPVSEFIRVFKMSIEFCIRSSNHNIGRS